MRRPLLLSLLVYGLLIAGLGSLNGGLIALAVPVVVYLITAFIYSPEMPQITATRTLSATKATPDKPVVITLTLTNKGKHLEELLVEDIVPPHLDVTEGQPRTRVALLPGGTLDLTYTVKGKRGNFRFSNVRVSTTDALGLFRRQRWLEVSSQLLVLPEPLKLKHVAIRPLRTRGCAGPIPSRIGGSGVNFFGVREYQVGDPLRWINWRASARHERAIFTNEFEQERIADVGIILDARKQNDVFTGHDSLFEHAICATAGLAEAFLNDGNRVGMLVYGRGLETTYPGYGKVQRERIFRALAYARTGDSMVFESLDYLPARFFPAKSQIVFVSPLRPDDLQVLVRMRAHGYQILVVSPDPVAFEAQNLPRTPAVELATRVANLERTLTLRQLRRVGVQVVDWQVDKPFEQVMRASLGHPPTPTRIVRVGL